MKHLPFAALLLALPAISTSCSTTRGFGQDLQKVGNRLEAEADQTGGAVPDRATGYTAQPVPPVAPPIVPSAY